MTLLSFIVWGRHYRNTGRYYWVSAIIPILLFSLSYGLRDGWGADFNHYKDIFDHLRETDIGLYVLNYIIKWLGFGSPVVFTIYSLILVVGFFSIVKGYRKEAVYILPLLWALCATQAAGLIRYWVAVGWLFIALHYYLNKDYVKSLIFLVVAVATHTALVLFVPIILICSWKDYFNNKWVLMAIFIFATILLDRQILGEKIVMPLAEFASNHISNERLDMYSADAEFWFSGEREIKIALNETNEIINRIRMFVTNGIILFFGYEIKNRYKNGVLLFNLTALSIIFYNAVEGFELVNRYVAVMYAFSSFILSFIIVENQKRPLLRNKYIFWLLIIFCYVNYFYRPFIGTETLLLYNNYIWD